MVWTTVAFGARPLSSACRHHSFEVKPGQFGRQVPELLEGQLEPVGLPGVEGDPRRIEEVAQARSR